MKNTKNEKCPTCQGRKYVEGTCVCNMEWRSNREDNSWEDCRCEPEQICSDCSGTGLSGHR